MVDGYTDEEIALMVRDAKRKVEFEINHIKEMAFAEGKAQGLAEVIAEGKAEGKQEAIEENIKTMFSNGATVEMISKLLNLDVNYVNEVLNQ